MANVTSLNVNGKKLRVDVDPQTPLLYVLRDNLNLTGTKYGCGEARCGACTVLVDGQPMRSCATGVTHERIGCPSTSTVHAPQRASPQPYFVPVRFRLSRRTYSSGVCGSTSTRSFFPFTFRLVTFAMMPDSLSLLQPQMNTGDMDQQI